MQAEEPVDLRNHGLEMNETQDHSLHIHQVGPEKNAEQDSTDCNRRGEGGGRNNLPGSRRREFSPYQPAGQQNRQGDGNQIPGIEAQGLNPFHPTGKRIEKIAQMAQEQEPEKDMEGKPRCPESLVPFKKAGKPEGIPDQPPHDTPPWFWGAGVVTMRSGTGVRPQTQKRYRTPEMNIAALR